MLFLQEPESNYVRLCRPGALCCSSSSVYYRGYINEEVWPCSSKTLFAETGGRSDPAEGSILSPVGLPYFRGLLLPMLQEPHVQMCVPEMA